MILEYNARYKNIIKNQLQWMYKKSMYPNRKDVQLNVNIVF